MDGDISLVGIGGSTSEKRSWGIGGRLGWLINPTLLPYLTAGYSQAHFDKSNLDILIPGTPFSGISTPSFTTNGWLIGAGLEAKINSNWSLRGEYRYNNYATQNLSLNSSVNYINLVGVTAPFNPVLQTFRALVVYKF